MAWDGGGLRDNRQKLPGFLYLHIAAVTPCGASRKPFEPGFCGVGREDRNIGFGLLCERVLGRAVSSSGTVIKDSSEETALAKSLSSL